MIIKMWVALLFVLFLILLFIGFWILFYFTRGKLGDVCLASDQCEPGLVCSQQRCLRPIGAPCLTLSDCTRDATACQQGVCIDNLLGGLGELAPCHQGLIDENNVCKAPASGTCMGDGTCAHGLSCIQGICQQPNTLYLPPPVQAVIPETKPALSQLNIIADMQKAQPSLDYPACTLFVKPNLTSPYKEIPFPVDVRGVAQYGQYLAVLGTNLKVYIYDLIAEQLTDILIREDLKSIAIVSGYITGVKLDGEIIQYRKDVRHADGKIEWAAIPLYLQAEFIEASPDGHFMAVVKDHKVRLYNTSTDDYYVQEEYEYPENARGIIVGPKPLLIYVTEKGLQTSSGKYIPARYGSFTAEGKFATLPLSLTSIVSAHLFHEILYLLVDKAKKAEILALH